MSVQTRLRKTTPSGVPEIHPGRSPAETLIPGGVITLFVVFTLSVSAVLYFLIERHEEAEQLESLLSMAKETARSIGNFREFYSKTIVTPLMGTGVKITHDYRNTENAIPLPATFSIDFEEFLAGKHQETRVRLLSDSPFPWRADRKPDAFEEEAIAFLKARPNAEFYRVELIDDQPWLRYAAPVVMTDSCVSCHNQHPQSSFQDWQVGDVRGIQEVLLSFARREAEGGESWQTFRDIILFIVSAFAFALASIFVLVRRNRAAFQSLENLAILEKTEREEISRSKRQVDEGLARMSAVLESATDAIFTVDEQGIVESINPAGEAMFGYGRGSLIGQSLTTLVPAEPSPGSSNLLKQFHRLGQSRAQTGGHELEGRRKNGEHFPMELSVSKICLNNLRIYSGIARDITERKAGEAALRASEEQARKLSMVAARTDNAVVLTDRKGRIEWVNESFTRISGYTADEVLGKIPGSFLQGPDTDQVVLQRIRSALRQGAGFNEELLNYRKDGTPFWVNIEVRPIRDRHDQIQQFMGLERDVTALRKHQEALEAAIQDAEHANQAKGKFLAMVSHEIRTPLNGVIGTLGLLEETELDKEQHQYVDVGKHSATYLLQTINDILDYSRLENGKVQLEKEVFLLSDLIKGVIDLLTPRARDQRTTLQTDIATEVPNLLEGDIGKIRQVLINLVGNAVKFTKDGQVTVEVRLIGQDPNGVSLRFTVEDTGSGISDEHQKHLFEEFWTQSHAFNTTGTGLGLAISRGLVKVMGGRMVAASTLGVGSSFAFEVPLLVADPSDAPTTGKQGPRLSDVRFQGRILLAEDNTANQMIAVSMLNRLGLKVDVANNGLEAVEAVRHRPYDLVLMDIAMPEMDGVAATHAIRGLAGDFSRVCIVAMTAHVMTGKRETLLNEGMDDYIGKPFSKTELIELLHRRLRAAPSSRAAADTVETPAVAPGSGEGRWVDDDILQQLFHDTGEEMAPMLVTVFVEELASQVAAFEQAHREGDIAAITELAHSIKSSSASYGAIPLSRLAEEIEMAGRKGDAATVTGEMGALYTAAEATLASFRDLQAQLENRL